MPQINLLPWRAEQRKERKMAFLVALGAGTLAALLATFIIYLFFGSLIAVFVTATGVILEAKKAE